MKPSILTRFEKFVMPEPNTGCWFWVGNTVNGGYGQFKIDNVPYQAHRVSFKIYNGSIPDGLSVCHTCDQPSCVNPNHLFLGTNQDNVDDKVKKSRQAKGSSIGVSKLTNNMVYEIRQLLSTGLLHKEVAEKFGVTRSVITKIKNRQIWQHLG